MSANRLHSLVLLLVLIILCLASPTSQGYAHAAGAKSLSGQMVQSMIDQVDADNVRTRTGDLSGAWEVLIGGQAYTIETRHALSGAPIAKAAQYLFEFYGDLGLEVEYDHFSFNNQTLSNIVAEKEGSVFPERIFMITSHYDDLPAAGPAPGADDNASGTTAVMTAAEILSQYDFGCTLRFVNFGAEEYGMIGSQDYARQAYCAGEEIRGVINADMIAWNSPGSSKGMDLHALSSVTGSDELAAIFQDVVADYSLDLIPEVSELVTTRSDHASFWKYGYPAILVSEDWKDFNPNYHQVGDDLDSLQDFEYYTSMIKASIGTLAHAGCLVEQGWGILSGQVVDSHTQDPVPGASLELHNPEWGYTWITHSDENGNYQFSAPAGLQNLTVDDFGYARQQADVLILRNETQVKDFEIEAVQEERLFIPLAVNNNFPPEGCP